MLVTYSPFYVPLIVCGLASAGVEAALRYVESRRSAAMPAGVGTSTWCDWAEAVAVANGWTETPGDAFAEALYRRMVSGLPGWGRPGLPYAPATVQTAIVEALFRHDALLGSAMTEAAIRYMGSL